MTLKEKLNRITQPYDLFADLSDAQKEANHLLVWIARTVYLRRKDLSWTQKQLADAMQVSQSMVCQWESGDYNFTVESLAQVFDTLGLKLSFFASEKESVATPLKLPNYDNADRSSGAGTAPALRIIEGAA